MDHAEGDRRINEGKEVVVEKAWQQFWRAVTAAVTGKQSTVDTLSVLIHRGVIDFKSKICLKKFSETGTVKKKQLIYTRL